MNSEPGTRRAAVNSAPKKREQVGHLSHVEKQSILNVYKSLTNDNMNVSIRSIVKKTSEISGVAKSTVYRTLKEYKGNGKVSSPKQSQKRFSLSDTFDEGVKCFVRRIVHSFFYKNEPPTLDKVFSEVKKDPDIPKMSRSTLYKLLKNINFKYTTRSRKSVLLDRDDIVTWRRKYLRTIKQYRIEGRKIYYLDETWLNEGHVKNKVWVDCNINSRRQAFIEGYSTGLKNPSGKGRRLIITHIGSEDGFLENGLLVFEGKKSTDYHEEMNAAVFEDWFAKILNSLPPNSVIILDNASYHSRRIEKVPTTSWKKTDIQQWLQNKNVSFEEGMIRLELLNLVKMHKETYNLYVIDEMAKKKNKVVLRLPPYHCELNPIELIWAQIKSEVAAKNTTFKLSDVKGLLLQAVENVTAENWAKCVAHIIKEEDKMCKLDGLIDNVVEPLIINLGQDSSSSDWEMSD